jgi:two-component system alkaline phosphatase synthesis response regulator PhoP
MTKKILVIDDEVEICALIRESLEQLGEFSIIAAYNGKDGLHRAQYDKPDLVLLDIGMPSMDGLKVLELLKTNDETYHIPVVMLSGSTNDDFKISASKLYSECYITKPFDIKELKDKIELILARSGG